MEEIIKDYAKRNCTCESLIPSLIELYGEDEQFKEAVDNDYDLADYDAWKHFQKFIGIDLEFKNFLTISSALWEENIDVMELPYNGRTV